MSNNERAYEYLSVGDLQLAIETIPGMGVGVIAVQYGIGAATPELPAGTAHFLEHIVCRKKRQQIPANILAHTTRDDTTYMLMVEKENLKWMLNQLLENPFSSAIDEEIVATEREIILREIAQHRLNPRNAVLEQLQSALFVGHGYGNPILGSEEQLTRISDEHLQQGLTYYECPQLVAVIGPWDCDQIAKAVQEFGLHERSGRAGVIPYPHVRGQGGKVINFSHLRNPVLAGAWLLPGKKGTDPHVCNVFRHILQRRIRRGFPHYNLRFQQYESASILTLDAIAANIEVDDLNHLLSELRRPVAVVEYKQAVANYLTECLRRQEDLLERIFVAPLGSNKILSIIAFDKILEFQRVFNRYISFQDGVFIKSPNCTGMPAPYHVVHLSRWPFEQNPTRENQAAGGRKSHDQLSPRSVCREWRMETSENNRYYACVASPLTARYHALYRVDCLPLGRLLTPSDLPQEVIGKGTLESIRYEGWHTLIQVAYSREDSLLASLHDVLLRGWHLPESNFSVLRKFYCQNVEQELKWRMLHVLAPTCPLESKVEIAGVTLTVPVGTKPSLEPLDFWLRNQRHNPAAKPAANISEFTVREARFNGAAVIWKLPEISIATLALQEAAFGDHFLFPTLESLVRKRGLSYRIVQSICLHGSGPYIYWGIQTSTKGRELLRETVSDWLKLTIQYANVIEQWFDDKWAGYHPLKHRSVAQLMRDIDRMAHYVRQRHASPFSLRDYVEALFEMPSATVYFTAAESD